MSKGHGRERFNELLEQFETEGHLKNWMDYTKDVKAPAQVIAALTTGRAELLRLGTPRALSIDETRDIYDLITTLVETNMALQKHAQSLAQLAQSMRQSIRGIANQIDQMDDFANFRPSGDPEDYNDD